jgi:hypothetical protein
MFSLFKNKQKVDIQTSSENTPILNVSFKVNALGVTDIEMIWLSEDELMSTYFAELIVNINTGQYADSILKILSDGLADSDNEDYKKFITTTIVKTKYLTDKLTEDFIEKTESPIVKPSEFSYNVVKNQE